MSKSYVLAGHPGVKLQMVLVMIKELHSSLLIIIKTYILACLIISTI